MSRSEIILDLLAETIVDNKSLKEEVRMLREGLNASYARGEDARNELEGARAWIEKGKTASLYEEGVTRPRIKQLKEALEAAFCLIVKHHAVGTPLAQTCEWGGFCPICHHADGSEPEMDLIKAALQSKDV